MTAESVEAAKWCGRCETYGHAPGDCPEVDGATPRSTADYLLDSIERNLKSIGNDVGALRMLIADFPDLARPVNTRLRELLTTDDDDPPVRSLRRRRR